MIVSPVEAAVLSCSFGTYLPEFVSPTPQKGAVFRVLVNETLLINITARASTSTMSELVFSGPSRMTKSGSGGQYVLSWSPVESEEGQTHSVCFSAQALYNNTTYSSELRCIMVLVGKDILELRLVNGPTNCSGRVEIFVAGLWGTVCGYNWDLQDAQVVCRQLGCGTAYSAPIRAIFGQGTGPIWMNSVACTGSETELTQCGHLDFGIYNCVHGDDAGVICKGKVRVQVNLLSCTD
ncbi:hypothetical protein WMY93_015136 [Mugilogobius chulae]|uniref:SRCR domain-containing protein n=1 Tax=Mugilogobius chulae TaxID=88201 RepID=A0AAW0P966_9GOBI